VAVSGGGTDIPKMSLDGPAGVGTVEGSVPVAVAAGEEVMPVPTVPGGENAGAGELPHGFAMAIPINMTSRASTSPADLRFRPSPVTRWLAGVLGSFIVAATSVG
jgi:hypothetical protein